MADGISDHAGERAVGVGALGGAEGLGEHLGRGGGGEVLPC